MPHSNTSTQRILVLGASIFEEGIAHLLANETDLQVSCAQYTDDLAFLDDITRSRPDVILLDESTSLNLARILKRLFLMPSLSGLRVIIVRLSNNMIDVYKTPRQCVMGKTCERQQFTVTKRDELLSVVQG